MLKKITFISILLIFFNLLSNEDKVNYLINHVKDSINKAQNNISQLDNSILSIQGMSSRKVRHLLNNICTLNNSRYLEIGVWKGSTFISALYKNLKTISYAIAIDNWSEFSGPKKEFIKNVERLIPYENYKFIEADCFKINLSQTFRDKINIYFYDGNHSVESQKKAFTYFNSILADEFIAIVDDYNDSSVIKGTQLAFRELNYKIRFESILPAKFNGDKENWWDGLYIAVISKY